MGDEPALTMTGNFKLFRAPSQHPAEALRTHHRKNVLPAQIQTGTTGLVTGRVSSSPEWQARLEVLIGYCVLSDMSTTLRGVVYWD